MEHVIITSVKIYFKNIVVNLFFSALMLILPYTQSALLQTDMSAVLSSLLVFVTALLSVVLVYIPFFVSVHRARLTKLWRLIISDTLRLSLVWAAVYAGVFYVFAAFCGMRPAFVIAYMLLCYVLWQGMVIFSTDIVLRGAEPTDEASSVREVIGKNKGAFAKVCFTGAVLLFLSPIAASALMERRTFYSHDSSVDITNTESWITACCLWLMFSFVASLLYNTYTILRKAHQ
ncbi:MAG: hypothetical protein II996_00630 [Oscillospiraceae bacterium]|nr:hypothetical protein [Oscillospiraceae bacterium]